MARFAYSARDRAGKSLSAELEAPSRKDALRLLSARGLQVAQVTELQAGPAPRKSAGKSPPSSSSAAAPAQVSRPTRASTRLNAQAPRRAERLPFLEALHDLTGSGLSAGEAVRLLSTRIKEPRLRTLCAGVWERISEGAPLSRALGGYPEVFDTGTVNLIQAGEATGSLNDTLSRLIAHLVEQRELRAQLMSALAYPVFMVFVSGGVILFFLTFLLPRLQTLLSSLGGKMPASTKLLIGASQFALSIWGIMAVVAVVLALISFSQTLSVLLENGITAAEALRMTEKQIANQVHRAAFNTATARVLEGEALSVALTRTGCFPDLVLDRLAIGENTGNVVPSLKSIAAAYQKIITGQLNFFTKVIAGVVLGGVCIFNIFRPNHFACLFLD